MIHRTDGQSSTGRIPGRTLIEAAPCSAHRAAEGPGNVKDIRGSNVEEPDVELTDSPVITSDVAASGLARQTSTVRPMVEAAFDAHANRLKAFALAAVRDDAAADDLVQEMARACPVATRSPHISKGPQSESGHEPTRPQGKGTSSAGRSRAS
jgi:hypothetical protein